MEKPIESKEPPDLTDDEFYEALIERTVDKLYRELLAIEKSRIDERYRELDGDKD